LSGFAYTLCFDPRRTLGECPTVIIDLCSYSDTFLLVLVKTEKEEVVTLVLLLAK